MIIRSIVLKAYFLAMLIFIFADAGLFVFSYDYRNMLGMIDGRGINGYALRILPIIALLSLYISIYPKILKISPISRPLLMGHAVFFTAVGIGTCMPWIGMFLAPLTPIASPYLSMILWGENGYIFACGIATLFVVFNIYIVLMARGKNTEKVTDLFN
jgi:hypothetical protein